MSYTCLCGKSIENDNWKIKRHETSKFHEEYLCGMTTEKRLENKNNCDKIRRHKYYIENIEKQKEYSHKYYHENRDKMNEINKKNQRKKIIEKNKL